MTQEIKKDMILHRIAERMERNVRTWGRNCSLLGIQLFPAWETNVPSVGARLCRFACRRINSSPKGHFLRSLLLLLMLVGASEVWGQVEGSWFIASGGNAYKYNSKTDSTYSYDKNSPATNFYMVPAGDPVQSNKNDAFFDGATANPQKPFLTTYKTGLANEAIWVFEKVDGETDTYYIKHAETGNYVIFEKFFTDGNWRRKCMHLDGKTPSEAEAGKFKITYNKNGFYNIVPKNPINNNNQTEKNYIYWNVSDRNRNTRHGVDASNYYGGLIGLFNQIGEANSKWMLERAKCATPTINFDNGTNVVTITTATTGATIYYTMGDDPGNPSSSSYNDTGTTSVTIPDVTDPTTIKAIAVKQYWEDSEIETQQIIKVGEPMFIRNGSSLTITSDTEGAVIYYTLEASETPSTEYTGALTVSSGQTIRAIAKKDGCITSVERSYVVMDVCATPTIAVAYNDGTATVTITNNEEGATIYYTTNGEVPDGDSSSAPLTFDVTSDMITSGMTVRAIAMKAGYNNSNMAEETVNQVAMPVIEIVNNEITISCATVGAAIYYTIGDETTPHAYTNSLELSGNISGEAIHAYATKESYLRSSITTFYLPVLLPVITYDPETNKVVITCVVEGVSIKYTTGQTETDAGNPTTVYTDGAAGFDLPDYHHVIKAIAVKTSTGEQSEVASLTILIQPTTDDNNPRPYLIQSVECTDFYMIPGDSKGVNTSSLGRPSMEWCFYYAGKSAGSADAGEEYDYYYIKNKQTNEYIYYIWANDKATVRMDTEQTFNSANGTGQNNYKYRLVYVDTTDPGYCIHPYTSSTPENGLIKTKGNNAADAIGVLSGTTNNTARWNLIPSVNKPAISPQLKAWGNDDRKYYKIKKDGTNYLFLRTSTVSYAIASPVTDVDKDILWYFDKDDSSSDEWVTYYYVVNAATGEYLYFNGNITKNAIDNAFIGKEEIITADNDRYLFAFAKTTTDQYYILPKVLQELVKNNYIQMYWDKSSALSTKENRADGGGKWTLEESDVTEFCSPKITLDANGIVNFTPRTRGATISYKVGDGDETAFGNNPITTMPSGGGQVVITTKTSLGETTTTKPVTVVYKPTITLAEQSVVYNGQTHAPELSSVKMSSTETELKDHCVVSSDDIDAGAATAIITQKEDDSDYVIYGTTPFTIAKSPLTIYADSKTVEYGDAIPELSFSTSGLAAIDEVHVNLGTTSLENGNYSIVFNDLTSSPGEKYTITRHVGGADASSNYKDITLVASSLIITGKNLGDGENIAEGITAEVTSDGEDVSVKRGTTTLEEGIDYTVEKSIEGYYDDWIWTITGKGEYSGSAIVASVLSNYSQKEGEWRAGYVASHDWEIPEGSGIEAWIATSVNTSANFVLVKKVDYLPAGVPVILTATADKSSRIAVSPQKDPTLTDAQKASNLLKVVTEEDGMHVNNTEVYVFYQAELVLSLAGTLAKGRIYMDNPNKTGTSAGARMLRIVKDEETTDIMVIEQTPFDIDNHWYSLDGRTLSGKPTKKGIYINDGRKVVIK